MKSAGFKVILLSILFFFTFACMVNIQDSPPASVGTNAFRGQSDGITISVDPFSDSERMGKYFGSDLLDYGILPLFVNIRNDGPRTILLDAKAFSFSGLETGRGENTKWETAETRVHTAQHRGAIAETLGFIVLGPALGVLVMPGPATQFQRNMNAIRINMRRKALKEQTLFANDSVSGFIYVSFPGGGIAASPVFIMDVLSTRGEKLGRIDVVMAIPPHDLSRAQKHSGPASE